MSFRNGNSISPRVGTLRCREDRLTATPALHTVDLWRPNFYYSYREAVIDGYLIDHDPPIRIETALAARRNLRGGIYPVGYRDRQSINHAPPTRL
jgi:type I site-specific restriction endonuclease